MAVIVQEDNWKVVHNGKQLLQTSHEDEAKNVVTIKKSDLKKNGYLWVNYQGANQQQWKRTIVLTDEKDNELVKHSGNVFKVVNPKLNALLNDSKTFKIYTWAIPADPKLAAAVRVRRVHLCTITII